jgi:hypothetical protein
VNIRQRLEADRDRLRTENDEIELTARQKVSANEVKINRINQAINYFASNPGAIAIFDALTEAGYGRQD